MGEISYIFEMDRNFLVISGEEGKTAVDYQMRMVTENQIASFVCVQVRHIDRHLEYYYDVTGKVSLEQWMQKNLIQCRELEALFFGLSQALASAEAYLLEAERVILTPQCIMIQPESREISFCYGAKSRGSLLEQIRELMQQLLVRLDHKDMETVRIGYMLFQNCQSDSCTIDGLLQTFDKNQIETAEVQSAEMPEQEQNKNEREQNYKNTDEINKSYFYSISDQETQVLTGWTPYEEDEKRKLPGNAGQLEERRMIRKKQDIRREWKVFGGICGLLSVLFLLGSLIPYVQERVDTKWTLAAGSLCLLFFLISVRHFLPKWSRQS